MRISRTAQTFRSRRPFGSQKRVVNIIRDNAAEARAVVIIILIYFTQGIIMAYCVCGLYNIIAVVVYYMRW